MSAIKTGVLDEKAMRDRLGQLNPSQKDDFILKMLDLKAQQDGGERVLNPGVDTGMATSASLKAWGTDALNPGDGNHSAAWQRWQDPSLKLTPGYREGMLQKSLHDVGYQYQNHWGSMGALLKEGWKKHNSPDFMGKHASSFAKIPDLDGFLKARGMNSISGESGGFLINPEIAPTVEWLFNKSDIPGRVDTINSTSTSFKWPRAKDLDRNDGTRHGGVQSYWLDEAGMGTESHPKLAFTKLEMKKLAVFVFMTDEIMANSDHAVEQYVRNAVREEINFALARAIMWGKGGSEPIGINSSGALLTIAKEAAQTAETYNNDNALKMLSQLFRSAQTNAVWLHHQSVIPQLGTLTISQTPVAVNHLEGGVENAIIGTLYNKPLIESELCAPLGDAGDVMLADLKAYKAIAQSTVQEDVSMHVEFMTGQQCLRFILHFDGAPLHPTPITPFKAPDANNTPPQQASFLRIAERA
jgi:HK97 family phage major capsid protein